MDRRIVREQLARVIDVCSKKNKIIRLKLIQPIMQGLMPIGVEEEPEDMDDDSAARVSLPSIRILLVDLFQLAFKVMHTLAMNVPPQQVFPMVWEYVVNYMQQAAPGFRKAAMMSLATMVEGCSDFIRTQFKLENVIPAIATGLKDPEIVVRRAACIAMAALADDMGEEISVYHGTILPLVFDLLGDSNERIRKVALETLDTLLEHMGENIKPYLPTLMEKLVLLLDSVDTEVKITIVSAIGSAAHAAEEVWANDCIVLIG